MSGIIGKKLGTTSFFDKDGKYVACTIIQAGPCVVTQVKTPDKDGYSALQLAFDDKKEKHTPKPLLKHFEKAGTTPKRKIAEFKFDEPKNLGDIIDVTIFSEGELVDVVGTTKGKGFQGVVKRHGFGGVGARSHGQHDRERAPGSVGASSDPSRVLRGLRMAGSMGNAKRTIQNLEVVKIMPEKNIILIKGNVPGGKNSYVLIKK